MKLSVSYLSGKNIVVLLDDKHTGIVFEETGDKIVVIPDDESESHHRFEIPKCKIMMMSSSSINKRIILDLGRHIIAYHHI